MNIELNLKLVHVRQCVSQDGYPAGVGEALGPTDVVIFVDERGHATGVLADQNSLLGVCDDCRRACPNGFAHVFRIEPSLRTAVVPESPRQEVR